jgi:dedicator of cytokinesis protein 1
MSASLISDDIYPRDWSALLVLRDSILLNTLHNIADRISNHHLREFHTPNKKIWQDYFDAVVALITDSCLQLEKFSENKRLGILQKYGDMRLKGVLDLKNMWYSLGANKHHFIPGMIDSFLRVALIPIKQINEEIIPIFFDMICSELYGNQQGGDTFDMLIVPNRLVLALDEHIENGAGTYEFRDVLQATLTDKFMKNRALSDHIDYVDKLVDLIDLLIEYRDLEVNDSFNQLKTLYLYELMHFYKNMNRNDLYLKYVDYLRKIHINAKNNVCAAHTLTLHAALLNWSSEIIEMNYLRHSSYPNAKHHRDLKERLYIDIIRYFTVGQAWENAFEFSKFLRERYEEQYDYEKLCDILQKQAELCKSILHKERFFSNYYLVGFFGKQFPKLLQNRQFVFTAGSFEDIGTFKPRIKNWFPQATFLTHSNAPTDAELNSNAKYIQITKLDPIYKPKDEFESLSLSPKLISYYQSNEVDKFRHYYRKETKLNEADPTTWWSRERTVQIRNNLPGVINFFPVKSEVIIDISPIQNAINNVRKQYDNLKLYLKEINEKNQVLDSHIRIIQGTVDAGVNGGLPKYEEFLKPSYVQENPDAKQSIDQLRDLIFETVR